MINLPCFYIAVTMWLMEESVLKDHDEQDGGLQAMAFRSESPWFHYLILSAWCNRY